MKIGIDIDGVILDSEALFRTIAEMHNTIELNDRPINDYEEPRIQEKYNWTEQEINEFAQKYFVEGTKQSNFMPYVKEVLDKLKEEGHELVIVTARGHMIKEMKSVMEKRFKEENLVFDKYYWGLTDKAKVCVDEKIDVMIDDNYKNCQDISSQNIKTLYFRDAGLKKIPENDYLTEVHNWGEIYKYIKYNNK